ncbi:MAG: LysM peptidoglycan-binding domain-containing protein [Planctomycetota bacterium]|nr:MAG: LysM peptidoglycan-binding domain-containing protein [Planctomycetota bacterium]
MDMGKYVAVGVLAMIVLAAVTYEPPPQGLPEKEAARAFEASYGDAQPAPPADPAPPPLPTAPATPHPPNAPAASGAVAGPRGGAPGATAPTARPTTHTPAAAPATTPRPSPAGSASTGHYVVRKGQTLRDVARTLFGDPGRWRELYERNRGVLPDPDTLREGVTLAYDIAQATAREVAARRAARATTEPASAPTSAPPSAPPASAPRPATRERTYTVRKGDTLYAIARRELGSGARWRELVDLNGLSSEHVRAGTVLRLPR